MTLEEFRAQRTECGDHILYPEGLVIERDGLGFVLTIANEITTSADLPKLEESLFQWATDEGYWS